jgi:hypothetical protein
MIKDPSMGLDNKLNEMNKINETEMLTLTLTLTSI